MGGLSYIVILNLFAPITICLKNTTFIAQIPRNFMKIFSLLFVAAFGIAMSMSSCSKTNDNPTGAYTCTCLTVDSVSVDSAQITYDREARNIALTQCANTQAAKMLLAPAYQKITCSLDR